MQINRPYQKIEIYRPEDQGFIVRYADDFIKIFNSYEQDFMLHYDQKDRLNYAGIQMESATTHYFVLIYQGVQYTFYSGGYESLEDLIDARSYDLKQIFDKAIGSTTDEPEIHYFPIYYAFKESGCHPNFDLWVKMHEHGFGFEKSHFQDRTGLPTKQDFEEAETQGFLKFGEEARYHWQKANELKLSIITDYDLYLAISKDIQHYSLTKEQFDQFREAGLTLDIFVEFRGSSFYMDSSDFINQLHNFQQFLVHKKEEREKAEREKAEREKAEREKKEREARARKFSALIKTKYQTFEDDWAEAQEQNLVANYEAFIQKAYTAIENGVAALHMWEFKTDESRRMISKDTALEQLTSNLSEKGYAFPERMEVAYWRRLNNNIINEQAKVEERDGKSAFLFFKEIVRQIRRLNIAEL